MAPAELTLRRCTPGEAQAMFALQNEVRSRMPDPSLFVPDTLEHLGQYLLHDLCLGAWDGARLVGYFVLRYCGTSAENYAAFLDVPPAQWPQWANADSVVVHPDYRGLGLQRRLLAEALPLLRPGITHLAATVSPANPYSLQNALASGFAIRCRREMYGGFDRYLLVKTL